MPDQLGRHAGLGAQPGDHVEQRGARIGPQEVDPGLDPAADSSPVRSQMAAATAGASLEPISRTETAAAYAASGLAA